MDYGKVRQGERLNIPAENWNAMQELVVQSKGGTARRTPVKPQKQLNTGIVPVWNQTGAVVERYRAVGIEAPVVTPDANEDEFQRRIVLRAVTPTDSYAGLWGIVQESLPIDGWGQLAVAGISHARINVQTVTDEWVEVENGSTTLLSGTAGTGQILWVKGGVRTVTSTGAQWALIRLPMGGAAAAPIGQYQGMHFQNLTDNQVGFEMPMAYGLR